jgi:predicted NBD/HSP70 family sugar kinase
MNADKSPWVVGVDMGATKIAAGLVSPQNKIVKKVYVGTGAIEGPPANELQLWASARLARSTTSTG